MLIGLLDFEGLESPEIEGRKAEVFNYLELLFHRSAALGEYLGDIVKACLGGSKKAHQVKRAIDFRIERLFKMPINTIKHSSFDFCWINMHDALSATFGYSITGPTEEKIYAPIKFRKKDKNSPEAYSMALVLRDYLLSLYDMTALVEQSLIEAGLAHKGACPNQHGADQAMISELIEGLNTLPLHGFPDEAGNRIPIYSISDGALTVVMRPLRMLTGQVKIQSEIRSVSSGVSYKLPYFGKR
ncbi:hypothetical protein [Noviluteimonas dokdonensis]|nr:hypothetical protein [Lysobacter dokdonensis]